MANRQTTPALGLAGAMARQGVRASLPQPPADRHVAQDGTLAAASTLATAGAELAQQINKDEEERRLLQAGESLKSYRRAMQAAESPEKLNHLAKEAETSLKSQFATTPEGKAFWQKHGGRLAEAARADSARIAVLKQPDFGLENLNALLADNQNALADTDDEAVAGRLLNEGTAKIASTPFLSAAQKETYRDGYLKTGILNLALNAPEAAERAADQYLGGDDALKRQIAEAKRLAEDNARRQKQQEERRQKVAAFSRAASLWQQRERGEITPAQYYVLAAAGGGEPLWGDSEDRSAVPLFDAYKLVRKMNGGETLSAEEVQNAGNLLISAYRNRELGLDETAALQNQLAALQNQPAGSAFFDNSADELADRAFMRDIAGTTAGYDPAARLMMESKAKLAFEVYQEYYARKEALAESYRAAGNEITPMAARQLARQAMDETLAATGLKPENGSGVTFGELRRTMRQVYGGSDEQRIWQRYAAAAPYAEDKKAAMRQIAAEEQRRELSYPQFDTYEELAAAGLEPGDRFYFRGRLAVMCG